MCFDICIRSLQDTITTMSYLRYRHKESKDAADTLAEALIAKLEEITSSLRTLEGRHSLASDPCPLCDIYKHHNHVKTVWRSVDDIHNDYDNNLLILGDDIDDKTVKEVFLELKNRFNLTVTPVKLGNHNKKGIDPLVHNSMNTASDSPLFAQAQSFVDRLPVWGIIIDEHKTIRYANTLAHSFGYSPLKKCFAASTPDSQICCWCDLDLHVTRSCSKSICHDYSYTIRGHAIQSGIKDKDVHWIALDNSTIIHFAGVRILNQYLKQTIINNWKQFLYPTIPEDFISAIDYQ